MAQARLFTVTQWLLMAAMAVCAFGVVVLGFAAFGLGVVGTGLWVPHGVPALVKGVPLGHVALICAFAVLAGIAILSLAMLIFHAIRQIVASAVGGDPFVVENADRLARTGWLLLGICAIQLTAGAAIAMMIPPQLKNDIKLDLGSVSPLSLLAILLIFVLAQIFRHGSEMRAELEGTV